MLFAVIWIELELMSGPCFPTHPSHPHSFEKIPSTKTISLFFSLQSVVLAAASTH